VESGQRANSIFAIAFGRKIGVHFAGRAPGDFSMILRSTPASPFGRKVRMAAMILGLDSRIEIAKVDTADPADSLRRQNPLGKIPTLVLDDGIALYDSRVIVEYLDHVAGGGRIVPAEPNARFVALRLQALGDGILDASILQIYEGRFRDPSRHEPKWLSYQADKVARGLAALEAEPPVLTAPPSVGQIAIACALAYQDFRFAGTWRESHPRLVVFLDAFAAANPAFGATKPA
jgi:glutathione S-transferase